MTLVTYPLDNTDYSMEDAALFHCTRTTGIYADNDFTFSVSGADNTITLGVGIAWMRMSRFKGVVAALKTETAVNLGLPDPVYPRIDHIVIQYDANKNVTEIVVKNGTAASNPQPPERSTSEALYEIHLAEVRREPGATAVTARNVTDLRLNENYCGIMAESVTKVDTAAINAQVTALIQALQAEIDAVKAGTAYLMKSGDTMTGDLNMGGHAIFGAELSQIVQATLTAAGWSASAPYTQTVAMAGVTAGSPPYITPVYSGVADADIALREACAAVSYAKPGSGTITFVCLEDKPQTNIPVQVEVKR